MSDSTQYCPSDEQLLPGNEKPNNPVVTVCTSSKQKRLLSHRSRRSVTDSDDVVLDNDSLEYDDDVESINSTVRYFDIIKLLRTTIAIVKMPLQDIKMRKKMK